jgi:hypothetical protein
MGSIENVKALLIRTSVLFLNSKHRNPYELSQLGQTVKKKYGNETCVNRLEMEYGDANVHP